MAEWNYKLNSKKKIKLFFGSMSQKFAPWKLLSRKDSVFDCKRRSDFPQKWSYFRGISLERTIVIRKVALANDIFLRCQRQPLMVKNISVASSLMKYKLSL